MSLRLQSTGSTPQSPAATWAPSQGQGLQTQGRVSAHRHQPERSHAGHQGRTPAPSAVQGSDLGEANSLPWSERTSAETRGAGLTQGLRRAPPAHEASLRTAQAGPALGTHQGHSAALGAARLAPSSSALCGDRHQRAGSLTSYVGSRCFQKESQRRCWYQIWKVEQKPYIGNFCFCISLTASKQIGLRESSRLLTFPLILLDVLTQ